MPSCFYHESFKGYRLEEESNTTLFFLARSTQSGHGIDLRRLRVDVFAESDTRLHVRIGDVAQTRFRAPLPHVPEPTRNASDPKYRFVVRNSEPFAFAIERPSGAVLFDTNVTSPLIFTEQFIELSARIGSKTDVYGLAQHTDRFRFELH